MGTGTPRIVGLGTQLSVLREQCRRITRLLMTWWQCRIWLLSRQSLTITAQAQQEQRPR